MKRTLSFLFIFLAAMATVFISLKQITPTSDSDIPEEILDYSWQIFNTQTWQQNPQDLTSQTYIKAHRIHHQDEHKTTFFTQPFVIRTTLEHTHTIQSQQAELTQETKLSFLKNVVIKRYPTNKLDNNQPQNKTLLTEKITYNTETQQIYSPLLVVMKQPQTRMSGIGFKANLQTGNFQLLSNVKTHHEPN